MSIKCLVGMHKLEVGGTGGRPRRCIWCGKKSISLRAFRPSPLIGSHHGRVHHDVQVPERSVAKANRVTLDVPSGLDVLNPVFNLGGMRMSMDNQDASWPNKSPGPVEPTVDAEFEEPEPGTAVLPITVLLSRRNLMTLLLKMDRARNGETVHDMLLIKKDMNDQFTEVHIRADEDEVVYGGHPGTVYSAEEFKTYDPDASVSVRRPVYSSQKERRTIVDRRQRYDGRAGHLPERRSESPDRRMGRRVPSPEIRGEQGGSEPNDGPLPKGC